MLLRSCVCWAVTVTLFTFALPKIVLAGDRDALYSMAKGGEIVLEDLVIYADRPSKAGVLSFSDNDLLPSSGEWIALKEALEEQNTLPISIALEFAPGSVVMTAEGREKLDFIATAMRRVDKGAIFEVHPGKISDVEGRRRADLGEERAREVISHLKLNRQVQHELVVPEAKQSSYSKRPRSATEAPHTQKFYFVNRGLAS